MPVERLNEIKQQISALTLGEKEDLVVFLNEQLKKDKEVAAIESDASNGEAPVNEDLQKTSAESKKIPDDVPDRYFRREYEWLRQHRHEYPGQYLAIEGDKLYAHGSDGRKTLAEARQAGAKHPVIVRVEAEDELPFGGW
jgi:hypothetical protein